MLFGHCTCKHYNTPDQLSAPNEEQHSGSIVPCLSADNPHAATLSLQRQRCKDNYDQVRSVANLCQQIHIHIADGRIYAPKNLQSPNRKQNKGTPLQNILPNNQQTWRCVQRQHNPVQLNLRLITRAHWDLEHNLQTFRLYCWCAGLGIESRYTFVTTEIGTSSKAFWIYFTATDECRYI